MQAIADDLGEGTDVSSLVDALVESLRRHTGVLRLRAYPDPDDEAFAYVGERAWVPSRPHEVRASVAPPGIWYLPVRLRRELAQRIVDHYAAKLAPIIPISIVGSV